MRCQAVGPIDGQQLDEVPVRELRQTVGCPHPLLVRGARGEGEAQALVGRCGRVEITNRNNDVVNCSAFAHCITRCQTSDVPLESDKGVYTNDHDDTGQGGGRGADSDLDAAGHRDEDCPREDPTLRYMILHQTWLRVLTCGLLLFGAGSAVHGNNVEPPGTTRDRLTFEELTRPAREVVGLVHNAYFAPLGPSGEALHELGGTLRAPETDAFPVRGGRFPSFTATFFSHHGFLVPVERGIIHAANSPWDIILSPGRVWSEPGDRGWSRAAFPFVLAGQIWNESHNGLATFLFNATEVTALRMQIVQESSSWSQFDAAASLPFEYVPGPAGDRPAFETELAARIPIRPWSALQERADPALLAGFDGGILDVTFSGLMVDGVLYAGPCRTRFGDYPYCRVMRHGVFSVTKTAGAALSLLWLAQKYGDRVLDLRIADYVDVTAEHDGWDRVTFGDALNMMAGIGDLAPDRNSTADVFEADEDGPIVTRVASARSARAKLDAAFTAGNYAWGPGEVGRYNSAHTFVLAAAMDAFLKSREGPAANLWDRVSREVLAPIGVPYAPMMHSREAHGARGIPIMGWGYFPTAEELLRIARLLQEAGSHEGNQLLSTTLLREVFSPSGNPGYALLSRNEDGRYRYHLSFWMMPYRGRGGCTGWTPEMMGYGGNLVTLMPNGMIGIRLADAPEDTPGMYEGESMAAVADRLQGFCP